MEIHLDDISWGNPSMLDYNLIQKQGYLDVLLPGLENIYPPLNSSATTKSEIENLMRYVNAPKNSQNHLFDEALLTEIKKCFTDAGADQKFVDSVCQKIADDVVPLVTKLKFHFNRPRPSQLAYYLNLSLYPSFSYFVSNPSYPSGHTTLTAVTCEVLGNLYPTAYNKAKILINEARSSRLFLGLHYPSDNEMAIVVAERIFQLPSFKKKYSL